MKVIEIVKTLLPKGTHGRGEFWVQGDEKWPDIKSWAQCPVWPPDIFAVIGTLIERSSCYTQAGPDNSQPEAHANFLAEVAEVVAQWNTEAGFFAVPDRVQELWQTVVVKHRYVDILDVETTQPLVTALLLLFAMADEVCKGMGWDSEIGENYFADYALSNFVPGGAQPGVPELPHKPNSLCALVPPTIAVVMPKTLTATVGCTIRSLSHNLALLPGITQCRPTWALTSEEEKEGTYKPIRLLVIPFPFWLPADSFSCAVEPEHLVDGTSTAAFFGLEQKWLTTESGRAVTAVMLWNDLIKPLLAQAKGAKDAPPVTGIVMPECALSEPIADALAKLLMQTEVSFFTTGILLTDPETGRPRNVAKTYVLHRGRMALELAQFKHHRWRLDEEQCNQYGLDFYRLSRAQKWWEEIDVSKRSLPFFALRRNMSMTVLICEDLARNDPAMNVVRSIGPNLVIALLMDGPQLKGRWPGRCAAVLGEDPGSGVLSVSCAGMVDRSNANWEGGTKRIVALWRGKKEDKEIELPDGHHAVLLHIDSRRDEQHTLDTRSDGFGTRMLTLRRRPVPLKLAKPPHWLGL